MRSPDGIWEDFSWYCLWTEIADGKRRRLASPKRKNLRHLQRTNQCIALDGVTDKKLRNLLKQYQACEQ